MRMRKVSRLLVAVLAVTGVAACGSAGGGDDAADLGGQKLEVAGYWSGEEQKAFEEVLAQFEDETGASVNYTSAGDDLPTVLQTRIDGSTPPNVALLPQPGLVQQFARAGALQPLPEATRNTVEQDYPELWRELGTVDGEMYGVYFKAANKSTFWYNTGLFDEAGVSPPSTGEELAGVMKTLADNGIAPLSVGGADGWVLTDWFENIYLQTAGPEMYDKLSRHEIPWTHPSVREALEKMRELLAKDRLAGGTGGTLQTDFPTSVNNVFGDDPSAAMVYEGDFVGGVITSSTASVLGEDAQLFPFPVLEGGQRSAVVGGDAAVAFTGDAATKELMQFLASPRAAEIWAERGGFLSPNEQVNLESYPDELSRSIAQQLREAGGNVRFDMSDLVPTSFGATVGAGMWQDLQDFLGSGDVRKATADLETHAAEAFEK
ncbi:ABC transporter substrate-binding protein [Qaidamihabitans albus]|uniref:ABC transporter substrate-binding protein n=1 Tax=Qaidamihabitans albus TaxID=2795733 RepID=UPI0018F18FEF|nr:extracellular solute-binding protein [Qaidamihabitans albus]